MEDQSMEGLWLNLYSFEYQLSKKADFPHPACLTQNNTLMLAYLTGQQDLVGC